MLFYEVVGEDCLPAYAGDLEEAHKAARCRRPYALVTIEVVDVDTSKAGVLEMLQRGCPVLVRTGKTYTLSPRGGLRRGT